MSKNKDLILKLVKTSIMIALLIVVQVVTKPFGQIITGSLVNLILAFVALVLGTASSTILSILSPFLAFLLGVGTPIIQIVPIIALGNLVYTLILSCVKIKDNALWKRVVVLVVAAIVKFLTLSITITKAILPVLNLPANKAAAIATSFSWTQLVTALIGGSLALVVAKAVKSLQKKDKKN